MAAQEVPDPDGAVIGAGGELVVGGREAEDEEEEEESHSWAGSGGPLHLPQPVFQSEPVVLDQLCR